MPATQKDQNSTSPRTYYVAGPTAVGKTDFSIALAERLDAEVVGCDAFQIYEGLPLLTAKPSREALTKVPHHLIGCVPLHQDLDVAQYRDLAAERINEIHLRGKSALVVGGTGLYLRVLTRGIAELPSADEDLRAQLDLKSLQQLQEELLQLDPIAHAQIDLKNRRRVTRAVEVCLLTRQPFSSFRDTWTEVPTDLHGILLDRDRTELYRRIDQRVQWMFESGVMEEVASVGVIGATAAQTLGLKEIQSVVQGQLSPDQAINIIRQATRRYAKRQLTWFKREPWLSRLTISDERCLEDQVQAALQLLDARSVS